MPDREAKPSQNIFSRVHITIMQTAAFRASPASYSKARDTFRPRIGQGATIRAGLGGKTFIHFLVPRAMPNGLVREHVSEGRPACIKNGLRHAGFGESSGVHIANRDVIELCNDPGRELVQQVGAAVLDLGVYRLSATALVGSLGGSKGWFRSPVNPRGVDLFTIGECGEVFQSEVDPNAFERLSSRAALNFNDDIQEPVPLAVSGEAASILDFSIWKIAGLEDAEGLTGKAEGVSFALQALALNRNPTQAAPAPVAKVRPVLIGAGLGVLLADHIERCGQYPKLFAAARSQVVEIKPGEPFAAPFEGILLPVVAIVPDEINNPGLPV